MKKILLTFCLLITCMALRAQLPVFMNLRNALHEQHPEIDLEDRLIAFNVWSVADEKSRAANRNFEKAARVYQNAILKGGRKGIVVVAVNLDNLDAEANIVFSKDGNNYLVSMKASDIANDELRAMKNAVYDNVGTEVYKNLPLGQEYPSINKLITR